MILSDNKYVFWRLACDELSSKRKLVNDLEIKYKRNSIRVPCYEHELLFMDFNTKKKALDHCKKLIEQGFYEKKIQFSHIYKLKPKRFFRYKNLRIEKWVRYKVQPDQSLPPANKQEKIDELKVAL